MYKLYSQHLSNIGNKSGVVKTAIPQVVVNQRSEGKKKFDRGLIKRQINEMK